MIDRALSDGAPCVRGAELQHKVMRIAIKNLALEKVCDARGWRGDKANDV
jgi:hypothetical protein